MIMCVPVHYNENSHQSVAIEARYHIHLQRMCKKQLCFYHCFCRAIVDSRHKSLDTSQSSSTVCPLTSSFQ